MASAAFASGAAGWSCHPWSSTPNLKAGTLEPRNNGIFLLVLVGNEEVRETTATSEKARRMMMEKVPHGGAAASPLCFAYDGS